MKKIKTFFEMIKFEHTVFALPFAYMGMITAQKSWPSWKLFFLVTLAMASARTAAMTLNRLIDLKIDALNPRTKNRALVTGEFKPAWAWGCVALSILILLATSWALNPLCFKLSPVALALLTGYHYAKRFTWLCHWILGLVLAAAPAGGWIAVSGQFNWPVIFLCFAVMTWVAGFDILYSLQDEDFDRVSNLHSAPVRFGSKLSLEISAYSHMATLLFLIVFGFTAGMGIVYAAGVIITAVLLRFEHGLVFDGDLTKINTAFFTINGWMGVLLLVFTYLDVYR